ncbi:unnamed protein product, partial [Aphanomyces euteiches]
MFGHIGRLVCLCSALLVLQADGAAFKGGNAMSTDDSRTNHANDVASSLLDLLKVKTEKPEKGKPKPSQSTEAPTEEPTRAPKTTRTPEDEKTKRPKPSHPTDDPTEEPTQAPTVAPTTNAPTDAPT